MRTDVLQNGELSGGGDHDDRISHKTIFKIFVGIVCSLLTFLAGRSLLSLDRDIERLDKRISGIESESKATRESVVRLETKIDLLLPKRFAKEEIAH